MVGFMKYKKFVSFSVLNALLLMVSAMLISSCQKKNISATGHFTSYLGQIDRSPASFKIKNPKLIKFDHFQDSKQIYIYCSAHSIQKEQCYNHHFNQLLSSHITKYGTLSGEEIVALKDKNDFKRVQKEVEKVKRSILVEVSESISLHVERRITFCKKNSKVDSSRCMKQYLKRDSLAILNNYQLSNKEINGHEYLFLKNMIQVELDRKLADQIKSI